jgi:acyl-CoA thioesterase-2
VAFQVDGFRELVELDPHGHDAYVGVSPSYLWGRVYGGQVVAQALWAAADTVEDRFVPHSLHAYFIRGGDYDEPIRFEVDRLRNGRSFVTRGVVARQSSGAILNLSASFHVIEDEKDALATSMDPTATLPPTGDEVIWSPLLERSWHYDGKDLPRAASWLRLTDSLDDDPVINACGLAYLSDDVATTAVAKSHPTPFGEGVGAHDRLVLSASLDHSVWFHRPGRADRWQFHDFRAFGVSGGRGLSMGEIFDADGGHLATVAQEVLLRERR